MIDSDEEAQSPAHHCEFRQAEVVLPHLPFYHSLTLNPLFYDPFPNTSDRGWRGWWKARRTPCLHDFLLIIFSSVIRLSLSLHALAFCHFLSYTSPFPPTTCLPSSSPVLSPSLTLSPSCVPFTPLHLISLSSPQLLLCQNGAKFNTSVDGEEKAVLCPSAPQLLFFLFFEQIPRWFRSTSDYLSTT